MKDEKVNLMDIVVILAFILMICSIVYIVGGVFFGYIYEPVTQIDRDNCEYAGMINYIALFGHETRSCVDSVGEKYSQTNVIKFISCDIVRPEWARTTELAKTHTYDVCRYTNGLDYKEVGYRSGKFFLLDDGRLGREIV